MTLSGDLQFLIDNVILPPQLPQEDDDECGGIALLELCRKAAQRMATLSTDETKRSWKLISESLRLCLEVHGDGVFCETRTAYLIDQMRHGQFLLLHIRNQNAAIILRKLHCGTVFEMFEPCPATEQVIATTTALKRSFPAKSVLIPPNIMAQKNFVAELVASLQKLSTEQLKPAMASTVKAGSVVTELRQSCRAIFVTQWLHDVLLSQGKSFASLGIHKRIRDDVCWSRAKIPWRRSALWLSLRVAVQLALANSEVNKLQRDEYKKFILVLISDLARRAFNDGAPSYLLYVINGKLARRSAKLESVVFESIHKDVNSAMETLRSAMSHEWVGIELGHHFEIPAFNANLSRFSNLKHSRNQLMKILARAQTTYAYATEPFRPPTAELVALTSNSLPSPEVFKVDSKLTLKVLTAIEAWVGDHLPLWTRQSNLAEDSCAKLRDLVNSYIKPARLQYRDDAEHNSIMLLTVMDLWMALDSIACTLHPLLLKYSPEIPADFLQPLLLPRLEHLNRLQRLEEYIERRHSCAVSENPSIFQHAGCRAFPVVFFDQTPELQDLRARIELRASQSQEMKTQEWTLALARHSMLMTQIDSRQCDIFTHWSKGWRKHDRNCHRHKLMQEAAGLEIEKYEWPVPSAVDACKAAVFESNAPLSVTCWRDITWAIIHDLSRSAKKTGEAPVGELLKYDPLKEYQTNHGQRIVFASTTKSFYRAHYKVSGLSLDEVLVNHGMTYAYYDKKMSQTWVMEQTPHSTIKPLCTSKIPDGEFACLRDILSSTTFSQNDILARQSTCSARLNIHEFVAFGSLRAGERLQLINILRELLSNDINFNTVEAKIVVRQIALQAGTRTRSSALREAHTVFEDYSFCAALLKATKEYFFRIEQNWKKIFCASILLLLVQRLLSLTKSQTIIDECLFVLRAIRSMALSWVRKLLLIKADSLDSLSNRKDMDEYPIHVLEAASLSLSSWQVDRIYLDALFQSPEDWADYVESLMRFHDHDSEISTSLTPQMICDVRRVKKMAISIQSGEQIACSSLSQGITKGIQRIWSGALFVREWETIKGCDSSWLYNETLNQRLEVHFNLVSGELLVAGNPPGRLPSSYTDLPLYLAIFGHKIEDVLMSDYEDMVYMTKKIHHGHRVYFALRENVLIIRSRHSGQVFEAVPRETFGGDFPSLIINESVQWINLETGSVEFRDRSRPWQSNSNNWTLSLNTVNPSMSMMNKQQAVLLCGTSPAGAEILKIFSRFEDVEFIHMLSVGNRAVQVVLPRFRLQFSLDAEGRFECRELSAVIDSNQKFGTFHGLQRYLVLKDKDTHLGELKRIVLVPHGQVNICSSQPHIEVRIEISNSEKARYYQYKIDSQLGQLIAENDLEAHFFKAYLHAVTSGHQNDALTGRTGVEESLNTLCDGFTKTSLPLSQCALNILYSIARLTPVRKFYPSHLKTMQETKWHKWLSPLTQHDCFVILVNSIINHNRASNFLFDEVALPELCKYGNKELLERAWSRNSKIFPLSHQDYARPVLKDIDYRRKDDRYSGGAEVVFDLASLISAWPSKLPVLTNLSETFHQWGKMSGFCSPAEFPLFSELVNLKIQESWPALFSLCFNSNKEDDMYKLLFKFTLIVFGNAEHAPHLNTLLAFAFCDDLKLLHNLPQHDEYDLSIGHAPDRGELEAIVQQYRIDDNTKRGTQTSKKNLADAEEAEIHQRQIVSGFLLSWPCEEPVLPEPSRVDRIDTGRLYPILTNKAKAWFKNWDFGQRIDIFERLLQNVHEHSALPERAKVLDPLLPAPRFANPETRRNLRSLMQEVKVDAASLEEAYETGLDGDLRHSITLKKLDDEYSRTAKSLSEIDKLQSILNMFCADPVKAVSDYGNSISSSVAVLREQVRGSEGSLGFPRLSELFKYRRAFQSRLENFMFEIRALLSPRNAMENCLSVAGLWPVATARSLLGLLSIEHRSSLPNSWIMVILAFGRSMTVAQRLERLIRNVESNDEFALNRELSNQAHAAWSVETYPEWLLLELQNNLLIRPIQVRVVEQLMSEKGGVLQLGMGEGKSSVILPMIVSASSKGDRLTRIVVLKPLANAMLRLLPHTLRGLVSRTVYHLPFSRKTKLTTLSIANLSAIYRECKDTGGVLLTLPEHLNSFRLRSVESELGQDRDMAASFYEIQNWLDQSVFDILDECDELLSPGYEMVYSAGDSHVMSGAPFRWLLTLELLSLVKGVACEAQKVCPQGIEYEAKSSPAFPHVRILNDSGSEVLMNLLVERIGAGSLPEIPLHHCNQKVRLAAKEFISNRNTDERSLKILRNYFGESQQLSNLFVIRGMIAYRVLHFALQKRWLVTYGLDRSRCMSAVPFRAKSVPSPSAEFSQPDVMLTLTALSYYYSGLTRDDIKECLQALLRMSDPAEEFSNWTKGTDIPTRLCSTNSINLDDSLSVEQTHVFLRFSKAAIDFYLREKVFPKEAHEFSYKLSTSAWDLCSNSEKAITSGFSGTMDTKSLLPHSVTQLDLPELGHTTALVLAALLRPENQQYICAAGSNGQRVATDDLLGLIALQARPVSVLIDVGAQVLDDNLTASRNWLMRTRNKMAVLFFNNKDEILVLDKLGNTDKLIVSPYRNKLEDCLIYLDEFHTRGTDFNLPENFRAAVTLGPGLTKDRFVQACMRMRKLGHGQSLVYLSPPEVDRKIRAIIGVTDTAELTSADVIKFTMHESVAAIQRQLSVWIVKGLAHSKRRLAQRAYMSSAKQDRHRKKYSEVMKEKDARTVGSLYGITKPGLKILPFQIHAEESQDPTVVHLLTEWSRLEWKSMTGNDLTSEQERELVHEAEEEREIERPSHQDACRPSVSSAITALVSDGVFPASADSLQSALDIMKQTSGVTTFEFGAWPNTLLATEDFSRTVKMPEGSVLDDFLRPVHWVLSSRRHKSLFLISPFEANELLPQIRKSEHVKLHVYSPRVSKSMSPFDRLDLYCIPSRDIGPPQPEMVMLLNLFAGQLYFNDYGEYRTLCEYLGLLDGVRHLKDEDRAVSSDGFVSMKCRQVNDWTCLFQRSPLPMLKELFGMRRKGHDWLFTHMGRIVGGRILHEHDFEKPAEGNENGGNSCLPN